VTVLATNRPKKGQASKKGRMQLASAPLAEK